MHRDADAVPRAVQEGLTQARLGEHATRRGIDLGCGDSWTHGIHGRLLRSHENRDAFSRCGVGAPTA